MSLLNDNLYRRVARKVLVESLALKKGECLTIESWNNGLPFARQVSLEARKIGAIPLTLFEDEEAYVKGVRASPPDMVGKMGKAEFRLLSASDAYVFIPGPVLGSYSHRLPRPEVNSSTAYNEAWYKAAAKAEIRGVRMSFGYIGEDAPSLLGKSVDSIVAHQLNASLANYGSIVRRAKAVSAALPEGTKATVRTPGSKLTFKVTAVRELDDGVVDEKDVRDGNNVCYIPPGYIYIELDPASASGKFTFSPTITRFGIIRDGAVEYEAGRAIRWKSTTSSSTLAKLITAAPEKARQATAMTLGLNPLLGYGFGQNALAGGVIGVRTFGVNLYAKSGTLSAGGKTLVARGRIK